MNRLMMNPYNINRKNQFERFITSGFIHKDYTHLGLNMFSLYFLGLAVEHDFIVLFGTTGIYYYLMLYLLAIAVSDLPTYFKEKNNPNYNSLGASGGVAAVVFAFIILEPMRYLCLFFALCMPGFILGSLYLVYSYFQSKRAKDNINHDAHLYGSLFGLIFCVIVYPRSIISFYEQVSGWLERIL
ncbi:MAG: rhomboid family intramembrane serine protease [Cyclobacteriaceae bacterium]|nr:rhomboid family intramembrane serine protease [Cyclobacteriaceae bacterium]